MTMIGSGLRLLPALFALQLWAVPSLAQQVGVNTAVNPDASGTPPGGVLRRLVLGQEVLYRERITTQAAGQTQIQFLDESSLTVGPNSDLTIDQFVYNPNTGAGQLAMSAGRGVLRFVGGKLSKGDNPVTMQTPSGTLAVRGGVFLANLSATGQLQVVFLYGKGLEVSAAGQTQTIPRPGFAVSVAGPGAPARPLLVLAFAAFAARLTAQTPQQLPVTTVTASRAFPAGDEAKIKGLITGRNGDDMTIRDEDGHLDIVTLTRSSSLNATS